MLLARYFLSVGGVLLALLFVVDAVVPKLPAAETSEREAFAQFVRPEPKKPEAKLQRKRKIARSRVAPPMIQVAQQPRLGFFNTW